MSCKCMEEIKEQLTREFKQEINFINDASCLNCKTGKVSWSPGTLEFEYHKIKSNGTFHKKKSKMNIYYSYCPFCGKEYKED